MDEVTAKYVDAAGTLKTVTGIITDIINKRVSTSGGGSFKANEQMGNGNYELQFKIDASTESNSKVVSIYLIDLYDMSLGSEIANYTVTSTVTEGLVDKPSQIIVSGSPATVKFTPNTDKVLKTLSIGTTNYTYADEAFTPEIPEGTTVTVTESLVTVVIDAITSTTAVAAVFGDAEVEPTTYTVNASAVKATVNPATQTVAEGANASVVVTPDADTELASIRIGLIDYVYADEAFTPALPEGVTFAENTLTITSLSSNKNVVFTFEDVVAPVTKYFVTASATNATVNPASQEIVSGEQATITVTPADGATLDSITIGETAYTTETLPEGFTFAENVLTITSVTEAINVVFAYSITPAPTVTYTVTASATNATVDTASQEITSGEGATITVTPNSDTTLSNITINGTEYAILAALPEGITFAENVLTIASVTEDTTVVFNYEVNPVTTYTVTTSAVKGTVDHETLTVNEGDDALVVITPDVATEFKSVTIDEVEYTYEESAFTPELPEGVTINVAETVTFAIDDVTADHTAAFTFEDIPATRHTVSASAVKGTVDHETQSIVEGTAATVVVTPNVDTKLTSVSYKVGEEEAVSYAYDTETSTFTPELDANITVDVAETVTVGIVAVNDDVTIEVTLEDLP